MRQKRQKLNSASWHRPVCGGFHTLIRFNCAPFFVLCRRHRVLTVTCLDACRYADYLKQWTVWGSKVTKMQMVPYKTKYFYSVIRQPGKWKRETGIDRLAVTVTSAPRQQVSWLTCITCQFVICQSGCQQCHAVFWLINSLYCGHERDAVYRNSWWVTGGGACL
jgi:hypothetical protein